MASQKDSMAKSPDQRFSNTYNIKNSDSPTLNQELICLAIFLSIFRDFVIQFFSESGLLLLEADPIQARKVEHRRNRISEDLPLSF